MKFIETIEGRTRLLIPEINKLSKRNIVFYNPQMELSRDISIAIASILEPEKFCDLLAGSGARGIRIANEIGCETTVNDINPEAFKLIERNKRLNKLDVNVTNLDANQLLSREKFDFIDIDPFGPPVRFIDSALKSVRYKGVLAVTATDTSALCGTYPRACRRKYDATPLRTDYYNELGLRILIAFMGRIALKYDLAINPVFSHCTRHYFRVYAQVRRSRSNVNKVLKSIGYIQHCFKCLKREYCRLDELKSTCECAGKLETAGPLWTGGFADPVFCSKLEKKLIDENFKTMHDSMKLVELVREEQNVKMPYYNIHKVYSKQGTPVNPMKDVVDRLEEGGFNVKRTHFSPLGVRTDARIHDLYDLLR